MKKVILTFALGLFGFAGFAQSNTAQHTVTLNLSDVFEIEKDTTVTPDLSFSFTEAADYEDGLTTEGTAAAFNIASNKDWQLNVKASAASFTNADANNSASMPVSVLGVRTGTTGEFTTLTSSDQQLTTGTKGGFSANNVSVSYQANPGFDYPADTYTIDVIYTVSAQ